MRGNQLVGHSYIFGTVFLVVYGQIVLKWQITKAGPLPVGISERLGFLLSMILNPWILTSFFAGFVAALCWMAAMTKFELSYAYPFVGLSFVLVLILGNVLFQEPVSLPKIIGMALVISGIIVGTKG